MSLRGDSGDDNKKIRIGRRGEAHHAEESVRSRSPTLRPERVRGTKEWKGSDFEGVLVPERGNLQLGPRNCRTVDSKLVLKKFPVGEYWSIYSEYWSIGVLGYWSIGVLVG